MSISEPEIDQAPPCPTCACRSVFTAIAPPGKRERPVYLRCCQCGQERADIEFYEQFVA